MNGVGRKAECAEHRLIGRQTHTEFRKQVDACNVEREGVRAFSEGQIIYACLYKKSDRRIIVSDKHGDARMCIQRVD